MTTGTVIPTSDVVVPGTLGTTITIVFGSDDEQIVTPAAADITAGVATAR